MQNKSCSQTSIIILSECISYIITERWEKKILITWNKVLWQRSEQKPVIDRDGISSWPMCVDTLWGGFQWGSSPRLLDWSLSLWFRFSFIILCVWLFWPHVPLCTTCVCLVSKQGVSFYLSPENQTWILWNKKMPLTTKPTPQPCLGQTSVSGKCSCLSRRIGQILSWT